MKFDVIIGNPPYQVNDDGVNESGVTRSSSKPIYPEFVEIAKKLDPEVIDLIIPARWISRAGKGLDEFTDGMLNDPTMSRFAYFADSKMVFSGAADIDGGVAYFVRDKKHNGQTNVSTRMVDGEFKSQRFLNSAEAGIFIPYAEAASILAKVKSLEDDIPMKFKDIVSARKPYGLTSDYLKSPKKFGLPTASETRQNENDIKLFGFTNKPVENFVPAGFPFPKENDSLGKYKVFISKSLGRSNLGAVKEAQILAKSFVGKPNEAVTETYLEVGPFASKQEAEAVDKYLHTRFVRLLVGILKNTQNAAKDVYSFVPLFDFQTNSAINWEGSVEEIDQQLFTLYGLSEEEVAFIEGHVKSLPIE